MSNDVIDGYDLFFSYFKDISDEKMIQFGLENLISAPVEIATEEWYVIKKKLLDNEELYIRGYGRDAKGTQMYFDFYKELFGNSNIKKDPTNNHWPTKKIESCTKVSKNPNKTQFERGFNKIQNFQVSHIFGCTKNPLLFTSPWNIIILPKVMDPFTGHEANGKLKDEFSKSLRNWIIDKYSEAINDYNSFLETNVLGNIENSLDKIKMSGQYTDEKMKMFSSHVLDEWSKVVK